MYTLFIYLYALCARIYALFNKKARLLTKGQQNTWRILRKIQPNERYVWFHAASLGEFEQGRPLMERLRREHPDVKILLTFFSPSGYEVRKDYDIADIVCYLPFDTPFNARRFIRAAHPYKAFFIKYEFWRNYIDTLHHQQIPVYSVSSIFRPSQVFFKWYGKGYAHCLKRISHFYVQNEESKQLLSTLGINQCTIVGDTRFSRVRDIKNEAKDLPIIEDFVKQNPQAPILVAGSTWPTDEDFILQFINNHPEWRLIIAPHVVSESHLKEIEQKAKRPIIRYTKNNGTAHADIILIDCYRLLSSLYRYATVAYVGGGFGVGIHNVPEAAVYGVPVLIGPNNKRFKEAQDLLQKGGCKEIHSFEDFNDMMNNFFEHPDQRQKAAQASHDYIKQHAEAADKVYKETLNNE